MRTIILTLFSICNIITLYPQNDTSFFKVTVKPTDEDLHIYTPQFSERFTVTGSNLHTPYNNCFSAVEDSCKDNNGATYRLVLLGEKKEISKIQSVINYSKVKWVIVAKNRDGQDTVYDFKLKEGDISFPKIAFINNEIKIVGFYSAGAGEKVIGIFAAGMSVSGAITNKSVKPFEKGYLPDKLGTGIEASSDWTTIKISDIMPLQNGSYIWTAHKISTGGNNGYNFTWIGDELCVSVNADNSFGLVTKVVKPQLYTTTEEHSISFIDHDNLYILYHDTPKNLGVMDEKKIIMWSSRTRTSLMLARVNKDGSYIKGEVHPLEGNGLQWSFPANMIKTKDGTYAIPLSVYKVNGYQEIILAINPPQY